MVFCTRRTLLYRIGGTCGFLGGDKEAGLLRCEDFGTARCAVFGTPPGGGRRKIGAVQSQLAKAAADKALCLPFEVLPMNQRCWFFSLSVVTLLSCDSGGLFGVEGQGGQTGQQGSQGPQGPQGPP